jgi:hypothetical protein
MSMIAWLTVARAEEPAPTEIPPVEDLPSAIDTLDQSHNDVQGEREGVALTQQMADWVSLPGSLVRGRMLARPLLGVAAHDQRFALRVGGALGHQWWTMTESTVQLGGESRLELLVPMGGATGYRVELGTRAGPWLGPVGLRVGPLLRLDRERWGEELLSTALLVGGGADLSLLLGPVVLLAGVEPGWAVAGERPDALSGPLPALGTETAWRAGLGTTGQPVQFSLELTDRQTAVGPVIEASLSMRLRPF